jgi:hypothetical protein
VEEGWEGVLASFCPIKSKMTGNVFAFEFDIHRPSDEASFALNLMSNDTHAKTLGRCFVSSELVLKTDLSFNITGSWPPI